MHINKYFTNLYTLKKKKSKCVNFKYCKCTTKIRHHILHLSDFNGYIGPVKHSVNCVVGLTVESCRGCNDLAHLPRDLRVGCLIGIRRRHDLKFDVPRLPYGMCRE